MKSMILRWEPSAAVHKSKCRGFFCAEIILQSVEFLHTHETCSPGVNSSIHAELYSTHTLSDTHALNAHSHIRTHTQSLTHRILVNPKHSFQLKFRHIPLIEGFALLFMGPSLEYGCFITISLVLVGPFFFFTTLHCPSSIALERRGL